MRRSFVFLFASLLILSALAISFYFLTGQSARPSIVITAPSGGETWEPGESHIISWKTTEIPSSYKIAITIVRIPPPPLPSEGQEFDPVIETSLPNTGSATWTISSMYPNGTYRLGLQAYESVPVMNPVSAESGEFTLTHPSLAKDIYPLYSGVNWNSSEAESVTIGTTTLQGASVSSEVIDAGMNPGAAFTPFQNYYDRKLRGLGWSRAIDMEAGGHTGGQSGYRKGNQIILTRFQIDYQSNPENAPSECPCTVTLSLFSATTTP